MKKRLLLVLTIVMLMCVAVFGANAAECEQGKHQTAYRTEAPTCDSKGYTQSYCPACGYVFSTYNYTDPIGHTGPESYVANGNHYLKKIQCTQGCGKTVTYQENGVDVQYYKIRFFNGHEMKDRLTEATVNGKTITFKHTKIAKSTEVRQIVEYMIKAGDAFKFTSVCPERIKDTENSAYIFRGWVKYNNAPFEYKETTDTKFENSAAYVPCTKYNYTKIEITDVGANTDYYAAWEAKKENYALQFTCHEGTYLVENVTHGTNAYFPYEYPKNYVDSGYDYVFAGWGIGDPSKKDKDGNYTAYDEYRDEYIHISKIPIYSSDAIRAIYDRTPRVYKVMLPSFDNPVNIAYGSSFNVKESDGYFSITVDGITKEYPQREAKDDYTYYFEKSNGFITDNQYSMRSDYFTLPDYVLDSDDLAYLVYNVGENRGSKLKVGNDDVLLFNVENRTSGNTFFDYYEEELANYNSAYSQNKEYTPIYFNIEKSGSYFNLVNEQGKKILDKNKNEFTISASWRGIYKVVVNETESEFTRVDAQELRVVNVSPNYLRAVSSHQMVVEVVMPVEIDGVSKELMYESYKNQFVVQVANSSGQFVKSGMTGNNDSFKPVLKTVGNNKYYHMYCVLNVPHTDRYRITVVASDAMNGKYEGVREVSWDQFKYFNGNIRADVDVSDSYNQDIRCSCLCHSMFSGVWATVLNILNSFFKVRHVCCPHMFDEIGHLLKYTR